MKTLLPLALVALSISACAPMTEAQREVRDYELIEFQQQFVADRLDCFASGRVFLVDAHMVSFDRYGIPRTRVKYICG